MSKIGGKIIDGLRDALQYAEGETKSNQEHRINAGTGGKPRGATRPVRVKPGQKSVADIVIKERR